MHPVLVACLFLMVPGQGDLGQCRDPFRLSACGGKCIHALACLRGVYRQDSNNHPDHNGDCDFYRASRSIYALLNGLSHKILPFFLSQARPDDTVEMVFAGGSYGQNNFRIYYRECSIMGHFQPPVISLICKHGWLNCGRMRVMQASQKPHLMRRLTGVQLIPRVIELDRKQPEFTLTFAQYLERVVSVSRQQRARARYDTHRELLTEIGDKYGVQPRFIVALWGIETDFGRVLGGFDVIPALVSLSYDGRRSAFFRKELIAALKIIDEAM